MARERKTNFARCTVWTDIMKAEISGPIAGCCRHLFSAVPDANRGPLLDLLKKDFEKHQAKQEANHANG